MRSRPRDPGVALRLPRCAARRVSAGGGGCGESVAARGPVCLAAQRARWAGAHQKHGAPGMATRCSSRPGACGAATAVLLAARHSAWSAAKADAAVASFAVSPSGNDASPSPSPKGRSTASGPAPAVATERTVSGASEPVCQNAVTDTPLERSSAPLAPRGSTRTAYASPPRSGTLSCPMKRSIALQNWQREAKETEISKTLTPPQPLQRERCFRRSLRVPARAARGERPAACRAARFNSGCSLRAACGRGTLPRRATDRCVRRVARRRRRLRQLPLCAPATACLRRLAGPAPLRRRFAAAGCAAGAAGRCMPAAEAGWTTTTCLRRRSRAPRLQQPRQPPLRPALPQPATTRSAPRPPQARQACRLRRRTRALRRPPACSAPPRRRGRTPRSRRCRPAPPTQPPRPPRARPSRWRCWVRWRSGALRCSSSAQKQASRRRQPCARRAPHAAHAPRSARPALRNQTWACRHLRQRNSRSRRIRLAAQT